jgi:hypothetical protein
MLKCGLNDNKDINGDDDDDDNAMLDSQICSKCKIYCILAYKSYVNNSILVSKQVSEHQSQLTYLLTPLSLNQISFFFPVSFFQTKSNSIPVLSPFLTPFSPPFYFQKSKKKKHLETYNIHKKTLLWFVFPQILHKRGGERKEMFCFGLVSGVYI